MEFKEFNNKINDILYSETPEEQEGYINDLYKQITDLQLHKTQVSGSLIFGRMEVLPIDNQGDFEIVFEDCYEGYNYKYINKEEAKQLADFLNAQL